MPAQALYLKWRPRLFDDVIGQEHITQTLRNALVQNRIRHAYLFNGPRGTGKTTMARLLAKAINCQHPNPAMRPCDACDHCHAINEGRYLDLIEIDAASHNSVDDVRELRDNIAFSPSEGDYKVYIIDEVHRFSGGAFDALLKTLEEPPEHSIFILATTEIDKVPQTIKSRSLIFEFRRVSLLQVADRLELIANSEGIQVDRAVLELVASFGTGSVRDSISLLDQLIVDVNQHITLETAEQVLGTAGNRYTPKLVQAIIDNNATMGLDMLNQAIDAGADPAQLGRQIVSYLRNVLLAQTGGANILDVTTEAKQVFQEQAKNIGRAALIRAVRAFNSAVSELRSGWQPQLPLELALIESTRPIQEEVVVTTVTRPAEARPATKTGTAAGLTDSAVSEPDAIPEGDNSSVTVSEIRAAWGSILGFMRQYDNLVPLVTQLQKARPQTIRKNLLTIIVDSETVRYSLENPKKKTALSRAISRVLSLNFFLELKFNTENGDSDRPSGATIKDDFVRSLLEEHPSEVTDIQDSNGGL